jgi:hypothetical protein
MAIDPLPWLEYRWSFDFPAAMMPAIVTRLRGTWLQPRPRKINGSPKGGHQA